MGNILFTCGEKHQLNNKINVKKKCLFVFLFVFFCWYFPPMFGLKSIESVYFICTYY